MKTRLLWLAVVLGACAVFYFAMVKPALEPKPPTLTIEDLKKLRPPPPLPPPELPRPVITQPIITPPAMPVVTLPAPRPVAAAPGAQRLEVPIQNNATIDFSTGAPQVRTQGKDADELEKALKEIAEATKDRTFEPTRK